MSDLQLTPTRLFQGVWEGTLTRETGEGTPQVSATHLGQTVDGLRLEPERGQDQAWRLFVPIPVSALSDGVQTFVIHDADSDTTIGSFSLAMGDVLEADIRAEMDLLRAELDLLKRAFRRHCLESA